MFKSAAALAILAMALTTPAMADVFVSGSTYDITATDFPNNYSNLPVTLDGTTKSVDGGLLSLSETITPVSPTSAWIVFNFSTPTGGPIGGDPSQNFDLTISNIALSQSSIVSDYFLYFTQNGTPDSPLSAASGFGVETNPITGSGEVLDFPGAPPFLGPTTLASINVFEDPYSFGSEVGLSPSADNDFHFGFLVSEVAVPEPITVSLFGAGLIGMGAMRRRRKKA